MNKCFITGRLTDEIQLRKTNSGKSVCEFNVAANRGVKDNNGKQIVDFITVVCWEQRADFLAQYAHKGTMLGVSGRIENNTYTKDDIKHKKTFITADLVEILGYPKEHSAKQTMRPSEINGFDDTFPGDEDYPWED